MYRNRIADLQLHVDDIDEQYIRDAKAVLISGTARRKSVSRSCIKDSYACKKKQQKAYL